MDFAAVIAYSTLRSDKRHHSHLHLKHKTIQELISRLDYHHHYHHHQFSVHLHVHMNDEQQTLQLFKVLASVQIPSEQKRFQMSSKGYRCGLVTNVPRKAVTGRGTCICKRLLAKLEMCPRQV